MPRKPSTPGKMPKRQYTLNRYRRVLARFEKLESERIGKARKYTRPAIYEIIAQELFITTRTVRADVCEAKKLRRQGQL